MAKTEKKDNLKEFLSIKNETLSTADLYFYGDIVSDWMGAWSDADQYPEAILNFLQGREGKSLNIYINSAGGSVFAGIAIYNMLKRHKGKKIVYVDGLAASIASVIAMAGDEIIVPSNAFLMIHKPWAVCMGNAIECRKMADDLDAAEVGIINVYKEHLADGVKIEDISKMMEAETWLNGVDAAKYFAVQTGEPKEYAAKATDLLKCYAKAPKEILEVKAGLPRTEKSSEKFRIKKIVISGLTKGV